jgi:hypothetical protein
VTQSNKKARKAAKINGMEEQIEKKGQVSLFPFESLLVAQEHTKPS